MVKIKKAGVLLGGLAGYLLLNRGIQEIRGCVRDICDAARWRAYYKYDKDGQCVPPGYAKYTRPIDDENEVVMEKGNAPKTPQNDVLSDALKDIINGCFKREKGQEEASEGQTEASESDISDKTEETKDTDGDEWIPEAEHVVELYKETLENGVEPAEDEDVAEEAAANDVKEDRETDV